jgi:hypothetical protein
MENKLITFQGLQLNDDFIKGVEDKSDEMMNRALIEFKNGLKLSIINGPFAYGGSTSFEIAPMTNENEWMPEAFDEEDKGNEVLGYCNVEKVKHYINKIGSIQV